MPTFRIAHIRRKDDRGQDVDLIIIPLDSSFAYKPPQEQREIIFDLQSRSEAAGLAGTVVPVWDAGNRRMAFIAPQNWHPFFQSVSLQWVFANINRDLYW
jgi:hypothetical protein